MATYISEQQRNVVESDARLKLICGCAGSHKTDTLIKCAAREIEAGRNVLFLTLVGSVTHEITSRLSAKLSIKISREKTSNHYTGKYKMSAICVSNFDAWVHDMLVRAGQDISEIGSRYDSKVKLLAENMPAHCFMKSGDITHTLFIDEAQDLQKDKMELITKLPAELRIIAAGDYLQTIFNVDGEWHMQHHAMNIFKRLNPIVFDLSICMRCPLAHVSFNNHLFADIQQKYLLPPMSANNENVVDRPFIFDHYPTTTSSTYAQLNAAQVVKMIETLFIADKDLMPGDVAILMPKINDNLTLNHVEFLLDKFYGEKGHKNAVARVLCEHDGFRKSIDWAGLDNKTLLMSIHADKGKSHKVVFALGITEGAIPQTFHVAKGSEITQESLLNVSVTRSTKYLFIGFCGAKPSRYLHNVKHSLGDYCYLSWNDRGEDYPAPYNQLYNLSIFKKTNKSSRGPEYREGPVLYGSRQVIAIKKDLSKAFDHVDTFAPEFREEPLHTSFGERQHINVPLEYYQYIGFMTELLIQRKTPGRANELSAILRQYFDDYLTFFTDDEMLISLMYEYEITEERSVGRHLQMYFDKITTGKKVAESIIKINKKVSTLHKVFKNAQFEKQLRDFLAGVTDWAGLWNVTLCYTQLTNKCYDPLINTYYGKFNTPLPKLEENVNIFCDMPRPAPYFEGSISCVYNASEVDNKKLKADKAHRVVITGRYDMYVEGNAELIEIKASSLDKCSQEWIIQTLTYALFLRARSCRVDKITIFNLLRGESWSWDIADFQTTAADIIRGSIKAKYSLHELEVAGLINNLKR